MNKLMPRINNTNRNNYILPTLPEKQDLSQKTRLKSDWKICPCDSINLFICFKKHVFRHTWFFAIKCGRHVFQKIPWGENFESWVSQNSDFRQEVEEYMINISFSLNSPRYPLKSIPEPFFTKLNGLRAIVPRTWTFFLRPAFLLLEVNFCEAHEPMMKKFISMRRA